MKAESLTTLGRNRQKESQTAVPMPTTFTYPSERPEWVPKDLKPGKAYCDSGRICLREKYGRGYIVGEIELRDEGKADG